MDYIKIDNTFFEAPTLNVCEKLIGAKIEIETKNGKVIAQITEIEAYLGVNDKACHSYNHRKTNRTKVMYEKAGTLYVYFIYGMHYNFNFVTEIEGVPCAILLRSVKILEGHNACALNRYGKTYDNLNTYEKKNISNGPGKVSKMFDIDLRYNGKMFDEVFNIYIPTKQLEYYTTSRIGIDYAEEDKYLPYRYVLKD